MEKTFIFLQELLQSATGLSIGKIPQNNGKLVTFLQEMTGHLFDSLLENSIPRFLRLLPREDIIYEYILPGGITFLLNFQEADGNIFCFGPVLTQPFSRDAFLRSEKQYHFSSQEKSRYLQLIGNLPVMASHSLFRTASLLIGHLTGQEQAFKIEQVEPESVYPPRTNLWTNDDIAQMRQIELRYEYSTALTDAILQGNLSLALHIISNYSPKMQNPVRNTHPLRNAQNYCIVLNTQLRYALEKSGIHPYRLDKLSNEIGLEIESIKSLDELPFFFDQVIRRYCHLVQENEYPNLKPLSNLAVTYIKEHLADNLTVKDTARALTVNANYLSTLFRQEVGMPFIDFVNRERTKQAAALLKHTNLQIQQIASTVGYNNTSYFAKQFLRFQGTSPSHYRKEGKP